MLARPAPVAAGALAGAGGGLWGKNGRVCVWRRNATERRTDGGRECGAVAVAAAWGRGRDCVVTPADVSEISGFGHARRAR